MIAPSKNERILIRSGNSVVRTLVVGVVGGWVYSREGMPGSQRATEFVSRLDQEGVHWVREWHGEIPDAFQARVALTS